MDTDELSKFGSAFAEPLENDYLEDEGAEMWDGSLSWIRDNKPATIGAIEGAWQEKFFRMLVFNREAVAT